MRALLDADAVAAVGNRTLAGRIQTDPVAGHDIVRGARGIDPEAVVGVAGNDVACRRRGAAEGVSGRAGVEGDARIAVGNGAGARDVRAEVVAGDQVVEGVV